MTPFVPSPEQAEILAAPLEPLRIAAGAGTGKTTTLALRMAQLVGAGFGAGTILGLTFTNKAAGELAQRANEMIGADDPNHALGAEMVDIKTYHAFAHSLLEEFGAFVGVERGAGLITPTFGRQIMSAAIDRTPVDVLNITWDKTVDNATQLAGRLAENLRTPEQLAQSADPATPVGRERIDFARVIARFEAEKQRLGVVDYGDLIAKAYHLVATYPDVAARIRDRYQAVFLDEYQDTNPAQRMLLQAIFGNGFPVTAVGDVDQTIYEWRGATPANFERFPAHFPSTTGPAPSLPLTLNRRSGRRVIEFANRIRREIVHDDLHDLQPAPAAPPSSVHCRWFATAIDEAGFIADEIVRLHDDGVPWREMAVLFRKNRSIELIRKTLEEASVPVEIANVGGLLDIPEIADLHAWLRIISDPSDHAALMRILLGSRFRLGLGDVRPLADWLVRRNAEAGETEVVHTMAEATEHATEIAGLDARTVDALSEFAAMYRRLLEAAQGVSLVELVRRILADTGAWPEIEAMPEPSRQSARLNTYRFLDLADEWSPLEGRPSLEAFLSYLRMMAAEDAEELSAAHLSGEDAVALLTVHRAKGLEWEAVFVPTVYRDNFPSKSQRFDDPYTSAAVLPYELRIEGQPDPPVTADQRPQDRRDILRHRHLLSEWRLAYVAATRAKTRLWMTGAWWYGHPAPTKQPKKKSLLYELAEEDAAVTNHGTAPIPESPPTLLLPPTDGGPDPLFHGGWSGAIREALDDAGWAAGHADALGLRPAYDAAMASMQEMLFSLPPPTPPLRASDQPPVSVTGLVTYATCPLRYYWTAVDPLPRRPSPAAAAGIDTHRRIELHNRGAMPLTDVAPDLYDAIDLAAPITGDKGPDPFSVFMESRFAKTHPVFVERAFETSVGGIPVRGRIDAIYPGWEVVDFKSGRPSENPAVRRQLEAYALAVVDGALGPPPDALAVTFAYLGGGEITVESHDVDASWEAGARRNVTAVLEGIRGEHHDPTPGDWCHSCDFLKFCNTGRARVDGATGSDPPGSR